MRQTLECSEDPLTESTEFVVNEYNESLCFSYVKKLLIQYRNKPIHGKCGLIRLIVQSNCFVICATRQANKSRIDAKGTGDYTVQIVH